MHFRWSLVVRPSLLSHILIVISDTIYVEYSLVNLLPKLFTTLAPVYRWFLFEPNFVRTFKVSFVVGNPPLKQEVQGVKGMFSAFVHGPLKTNFKILFFIFLIKLSSYYANFVYDPYRFQYQMGPTPKTLEFLVRFRLYFCF